MNIFRNRDDDLVLLAKFEQPLSAHSLKILLQASGIDAIVTGEESTSLLGGPSSTGVAGVEVLVRRADLDDARLVMLEVPAASEVMIAAWTCSCGEEVDEGFAVCWSCGNQHHEIL